jgi:hypothetical protein
MTELLSTIPILIEGGDLSGKTTLAQELKKQGFKARKYTWLKNNYFFKQALDKAKIGDNSDYEELFIKACELELERVDLFGNTDIQESSSIIRAFAYAYAIEEYDFLLKLEKLMTKYPKFYKIFHLHTSRESRVNRLTKRIDEDAANKTDMFVVTNPKISERIALGVYYGLALMKQEILDIDTGKTALHDGVKMINNYLL